LKTVNAAFVRNHIAETREMAREAPLVVENHGKPEFVIVSAEEFAKLTGTRKSRQTGYARHVLEGVDIDELLATPVPGIEEYTPAGLSH